jgi:hypothetical protein
MPGCCHRYKPSSNDYIKPYIPKWCPPEPNNDPKRFEKYCKPTLCRSEPLSHSEYLRLRAKNGGCSLSSGSVLQVGQGVYKKTIWTNASNGCQTNMAVPAVHPGGRAADAGYLIEAKGAFAGSGQTSWYDIVNRTAHTTILRNKGLAIAATDYGCSPCGKVGTTKYVTPGCPDSIKNLANLS